MIDQQRLEALCRQGDPQADDVVSKLAGEAGDCGELAEFLCDLPPRLFGWKKGHRPPRPAARPALNAQQAAEEARRWQLIEDFFALPFDIAPARLAVLRQAQDAYPPHANLARAIFGVYSLPQLYAHPEIALTLAGSGQLMDHVRRRIDETQLFVDAVMKPGSLEPGGSGRLWIRKVRLMHAVRRAIARCDLPPAHDPLARLRGSIDWTRRNDLPIDQVELAFVMLMFSWVVVDGLQRLGYPMKADAARNHVLAWSVIAEMLGVVPGLLPSEADPLGDAKALFEQVKARNLATAGRSADRSPAWPAAGRDSSKAASLHAATLQAGLAAGRQLMATLMVLAIDIQQQTLPEAWRWTQDVPLLANALRDLPRVLVRRLVGTETADLLYLGRPPFLHWLICSLALIFIDLRQWNSAPKTASHASGPVRGPMRAAHEPD